MHQAEPVEVFAWGPGEVRIADHLHRLREARRRQSPRHLPLQVDRVLGQNRHHLLKPGRVHGRSRHRGSHRNAAYAASHSLRATTSTERKQIRASASARSVPRRNLLNNQKLAAYVKNHLRLANLTIRLPLMPRCAYALGAWKLSKPPKRDVQNNAVSARTHLAWTAPSSHLLLLTTSSSVKNVLKSKMMALLRNVAPVESLLRKAKMSIDPRSLMGSPYAKHAPQQKQRKLPCPGGHKIALSAKPGLVQTATYLARPAIQAYSCVNPAQRR
mmetsp:Transcript_51356/g.96275  ORF Transcript_51356/g.96275 Transcript_51356/m.96275 type:complete len:272 (+) Transcript_51356:144-959(+)